jgi:hypothetical protein
MVCRCCDVTLADLQTAIAAGYDHSETLKRATKVLTGPCQGRACRDLVLGVLGDVPAPRSRPPAFPVPLGLLAGGPPVDPC